MNNAAVVFAENHAHAKLEYPAKTGPKTYELTRQDFKEIFEVNVYGVVEAISKLLYSLVVVPTMQR